MEFIIRRAESDDIPRIFEIARDNTKNPWKQYLFESELDNKYACLLCTEIDGMIIGFCDAHIVFDNAHINELCVGKEYRKKGAATALTGEIISIAKKSGCTTVTLEVREQNAAARALYEKLGFRVASRRAGFYHDPPDDALTMIKDI